MGDHEPRLLRLECLNSSVGMFDRLNGVGWAGFAGVVAAAALPFVTLVANNPSEPLPLRRLGIYWMVIVGLTVSLVVISASSRGAAIAVLCLYLVFSFSVVHSLQTTIRLEDVFGIDGSLIVLVGLLLAGILLTRFDWTHSAIAIAAVLFLVPPTLQILFSPPLETATPRLAAVEALELTPKSRPNIWWFVLDAYGRGDVLDAAYPGIDTRIFEGALQERGFHINDRAVTNYPLTYLSVASTLQMDLLVEEGDDITNQDGFYRVIQGNNRVVSTLR